MKAKDISGQAPGGKRTRLAEALPLDTPFVVQVFPIYACNFKCSYCIFSVQRTRRGPISDRVIMEYDLYRKFVDDLLCFPDKVKVLRFVGIGEPLLHKKIVDMVKYAAEGDAANTIEILTNGSLLTPDMSDALIAAGLTRLVVSVQGTSAEKYNEVSGVDIAFDELINNLRYAYENSGEAHVYIKIVDSALADKEDQQRFYEIYGDLCDTIAVEHTVPLHVGVDFEKVLGGEDKQVTQFGLPLADVAICPQPFFHMQINPDGKVVPCYSWDYPEIMGDCNDQSMVEIWKGETFQQFRRKMLEGTKSACEICAKCTMIKYRLFPEDDLAEDAERLKKLYR